LVLATLLGAQLFLCAVTQAPAAAAGILPPSDPASNINFDVMPQCTQYGDSSAVCLNSILHDINFGLNSEGLPPMVLPNGFPQMGVDEQLLVLANLERGARGLTRFAGLSPTLDTASAQAAAANTDPSPPAGYTFTQWGSNYADDVNPLESDFLWMYDDGMGGTNVDCQVGNTSGCWGHRNNILGPWLSEGGQSTAMGDGSSGSNIYTEIFANKVGTPDGVVDPYGSVTFPTQVAPQVVTVSTKGVTSPGGGTPVTIDGTYFSYFSAGQVPTVDFGSSPATNVHVNWDGQLTADAPANPFGGQAGTVVVTVTTPAGTSDATPNSETNEFTYSLVPATTVTAVTPNIGSELGGQPVTITGGGFAGTTTVDFGSTPATTFTVNSNSTITATAPAYPSGGPVDVVVTTSAYGPSTTSSLDRFTYKLGSTTTASVSASPVSLGTPVTYSATVTSTAGSPTGTVTFKAESTTLCTTPLVSGTVSCQASNAPTGSDTATATYSGDANFAPSSGSTSLMVMAGDYSALTPTRICDTRAGNPSILTGAAAQCNGTADSGSTNGAGATKTISVAGNFGVPADATAVVLNVTAAYPAAAGYLSVYPTGAVRPLASNLNYSVGRAVPNLVEVGIGTNGDISLFSSASTDIVVDVEGYVSSTASGGSGAGLYNPLPTPTRICDTRAGNPSSLSGSNAQCGGPGGSGDRLSAQGTMSVQVAGIDGIPADVSAAVLNVTVVNPTSPGYVTVFPEDGTQPDTSNVNYAAGQNATNRVIVPLSGGASPGQISIFSSSSADIIVDISGYFSAAGSTGTEFTAEPAPVRICDTRAGNPSNLSGAYAQCGSKTIGAGSTLTMNVSGLAGVPSNAKAVVVNLTGVNPTSPTFLSVFPGPALPATSDLNPLPGTVRANMIVATLSADGTISIFNNRGNTDVVVDVLGWYS
jgi:hypothetical protein